MVTARDRIARLVEHQHLLRASDLATLSLGRRYLSALVAEGTLIRIGRGLYTSADADATANRSLAQVSKRVPHGVVALLSALRFHNLTTQNPFEVWLAISTKARRPKLDYPSLRVVRFSGRALAEGVERHVVEGVPIRVYGVAKTVADCFKYRNKIGVDVAIEALRDAWQRGRITADELWHYAKVCRVANVVRPYAEALQ